MFNESGDFDKMMEKRKAFYNRMVDDFDFRMQQVDQKLRFLNAREPKPRYVRYKSTVHDTCLNIEYEIGVRGEFIEYTGGKSY